MGAGGARPGSSGSSGGSWSAGGATAAGHHGSLVQGAGAGQGGSGSCNSNNPSPVSMMGAAQNSHRSSPCNELLAAAMRSSAHATNAAGELHCALWGYIIFEVVEIVYCKDGNRVRFRANNVML